MMSAAETAETTLPFCSSWLPTAPTMVTTSSMGMPISCRIGKSRAPPVMPWFTRLTALPTSWTQPAMAASSHMRSG